LMMCMLEAAGLPLLTDGKRGADLDNPRGYFELDAVKGLAEGEDRWVEGARGLVVKVIAPLLRYLPRTLQYRVVLMRRDLHEILASQRLMLEHRREPTADRSDDLLGPLFEGELADVEAWLAVSPHVIGHIVVSYNELVHEPSSSLERIAELLGRDLDLAAMSAVIDPALYRNRKS